MECWNIGIMGNSRKQNLTNDSYHLKPNVPSFHSSIIPILTFYAMLYALCAMLLFSFSFEPTDQYTNLCSQIGNHDDENHQQKGIRIDDPQNIHGQPSLFIIPSSSFIVHRPSSIVHRSI
jgi:hypothetical protein